MSILAIDQGTTSTRGILVAPDGGTRLVFAHSHRQHYPRPGWVEHDPEALLADIRACIEAAPQARAIGLDHQGESCLGWDRETGRAVSPVIVWQDERTAHITARLRAEGAEPLSLVRAGLPLDPYFSASKLGWILREIPEAASLAAAGRLCLGTTDAFFRHRLTGRFETDIATASRTGLLDLARGVWDAELCALFGVPMEALPAITATHGGLGEIGARPLAASITDQQAALRGHGAARPGEAKITFGTGAFVLAVTGALTRANGPLPTVAWSGEAGPVHALDGGVYAAGAALNWARGLGLFSDFDALEGFAAPVITRGLAFVPALSGLACPHWDRAARGAWLGMSLDTTPRDLVQAVIEGIAFRTAEVVAAMDAACPIRAPLSIDGGLTRNAWFCQFLADILGRAVLVSEQPELTALGTAILAAQGAGAVLEAPRRGHLLQPRAIPADWAARFEQARGLIQSYR